MSNDPSNPLVAPERRSFVSRLTGLDEAESDLLVVIVFTLLAAAIFLSLYGCAYPLQLD